MKFELNITLHLSCKINKNDYLILNELKILNHCHFFFLQFMAVGVAGANGQNVNVLVSQHKVQNGHVHVRIQYHFMVALNAVGPIAKRQRIAYHVQVIQKPSTF